jgi:hypothetical protein
LLDLFRRGVRFVANNTRTVTNSLSSTNAGPSEAGCGVLTCAASLLRLQAAPDKVTIKTQSTKKKRKLPLHRIDFEDNTC